jgi:hypothetical protein
VVLAEQVGRRQVFRREGVVRAQQTERRPVVQVRSCTAYPLRRAGEQMDRVAPTVAALRARGHAPLGAPQLAQRDPQAARGLDGLPIGQRGKPLPAAVDAGLLARARHWLDRAVRTGEGDLPPVGLA